MTVPRIACYWGCALAIELAGSPGLPFWLALAATPPVLVFASGTAALLRVVAGNHLCADDESEITRVPVHTLRTLHAVFLGCEMIVVFSLARLLTACAML